MEIRKRGRAKGNNFEVNGGLSDQQTNENSNKG